MNRSKIVRLVALIMAGLMLLGVMGAGISALFR
jgi:hypothetical protein